MPNPGPSIIAGTGVGGGVYKLWIARARATDLTVAMPCFISKHQTASELTVLTQSDLVTSAAICRCLI